MWKRVHVFVVGVLLLMEKCPLSSSFLISSEEELMLVPSVAFRYHSTALKSTAIAQSSDDWILYAQGKTFNLF